MTLCFFKNQKKSICKNPVKLQWKWPKFQVLVALFGLDLWNGVVASWPPWNLDFKRSDTRKVMAGKSTLLMVCARKDCYNPWRFVSLPKHTFHLGIHTHLTVSFWITRYIIPIAGKMLPPSKHPRWIKSTSIKSNQHPIRRLVENEPAYISRYTLED